MTAAAVLPSNPLFRYVDVCIIIAGFTAFARVAAPLPWKPVFRMKAFLPALFGSMALGLFASSSSGSKVVKGGIKGVLPVLIIMTVLSLAARLAGYGSVLGGLVGIFIIVILPIGILTSYVLWKKGKIQVVDKEQK